MALNWVGTPGAPVTTISLMPAALSPCRLAVAICTENQFMVNSELNVPDGWQPSLLLCIQSRPGGRVWPIFGLPDQNSGTRGALQPAAISASPANHFTNQRNGAGCRVTNTAPVIGPGRHQGC